MARRAVVVVAAAVVWLITVGVAPRFTAGADGLMAPPQPAGPESGCQRNCGGVDIPFPFGYGPSHCRLHEGFLIQCNDTGNGVLKPFLGISGVEVINISLTTSQVRVLNNISSYCYNTSYGGMMKPSEWWWDLSETLFTLSDTANKFTVLGCGVLAYIVGDSYEAEMFSTGGCVSTCQPNDVVAALTNGSCSPGKGCCQTAIPKGLQSYKVSFDMLNNDASAPPLSASTGPCTYAVLMESANLTFSNVTPSSALVHRQVPVVLDWVVSQKMDCSMARTKPGSVCVSSNSGCVRAPSGQGYICNCMEGFTGNPYLPDGCKDIDECLDGTKCFGHCTNTIGNFTCSCHPGYQGNASIYNGCQKYPFRLGARIAVGIFAGLLVALLAFLTIEVILKKRSNRRQGYFEQHGGQLLLEILKRESIINFTFFDRGDIVKATNSFRKANIIGEGAHGAVYKANNLNIGGGTTTAAVKRCKQIEKTRTDEFVRELVILCRVSHPNIVKLLGCCLHFEAPMLVYEFMEHGTLNDLLHGRERRCVTLATRLRIAAETAEALTHLHSSSHPTLHGDVKPENILLGDNWVAKVSDFGCSTIDDNLQVVPKGTLAYLDPELLKNFQISEKSDVHSFGVVLMELLTRRKPLTKVQKNHLTIIFQESMRNGTLDEILDPDIIVEVEGVVAKTVIHQAAELAIRCTVVPGTTRPAMRQVAEELRRMSNEMPESFEALQALECSGYSSYAATESETATTGFYTVGNISALSTELAR